VLTNALRTEGAGRNNGGSRPNIVSAVTEFRLISVEDVRETLEELAVLAVTDEEFAARGVPLVHEGFWDGLGDYQAARIELRTGEQVFLRRLEWPAEQGENRVDVFGALSRPVESTLEHLLAALGLGRDCVSWRIADEDGRRCRLATRGGLRNESGTGGTRRRASNSKD
jgi:hypothetical protein